jgi:transglutaminase superfamily protein
VANSPTHIVRKLASLSLADWGELFRAQWALLVAHAIVRGRPVGSLATPASSVRSADVERLPEARRAALAIVRAARFGIFRPQCLVRSVALSRMLAARGIEGSIVRVGVRRKNGEFLAHAWVELANETLGDADEHVGTFVPLTNLDIRSGG